jgi:hypothetical protein
MKTLLRALVIVLLAAELASAAVVFDAVSTGSVTGGSSIGPIHTMSASTNRLLLCGVSGNDAGGSTVTVAYNGASMASIGFAQMTGIYHVEVFALTAPATGANTVSVNSNQTSDYVVGCISFTGVDQTTPLGTVVTENHTNTTLSSEIAIPTGGMGASFGFDREPGNCGAHTSSNTERYDLCDAGSNIGGFGSTSSSPGSVSMVWTGLAGHYVGQVAVPINAAAAASSVRVIGRPQVQ